MSALCPECGESPQYTSFCTRCAQLFRPPRRYWERQLAALWSVDQYEALLREVRRLHASGLTSTEAAARLSITIDKLNYYRRQTNLPCFAQNETRATRPDGWTSEQDHALERAIADGLTKEQTAAKIGRSVNAVCTRRWHLGLPQFSRLKRPTKPSIWTAERIKTLALLRAEHRSYGEAAAALHVTRGAIAGAVRKHLKERVEP